MCVCAELHQTVCGNEIPSIIASGTYVCTRPEGHEGPCVACIRTAHQHNLTGVELDG